jgi:hypothetical protein
MLNTDVRRAIGANQSKQEHLMPLAALMVHVDMDHDSEQTVELAIALAERFQATLIGVAGCALWPASRARNGSRLWRALPMMTRSAARASRATTSV